MSSFYNENDPVAAQWLRNLISAGHIAPGVVDERDIRDIRPSEIKQYTQCHFFAGIGVWSHALRNAGWPDDRPVWTGSCPCQPFSSAGRKRGSADERHLWPHWFHLIEACRPIAVFGEQVASGDGLAWIDLVSSDMEGTGYTFGAVDLCAAGVGAPHIRQRLYFVANSVSSGRSREGWSSSAQDKRAAKCSGVSGLADAMPAGRAEWGAGAMEPAAGGGLFDGVASPACRPGPANGFWRDSDWLLCTDGKWRPVEPGTFPLADGTPGRVGRLRAYGNAIVAPAAQAFIEAAMEVDHG